MTCLDVLEIEEIQSDKKYNQLKEGGGIDIVIYSAFSFATHLVTTDPKLSI